MMAEESAAERLVSVACPLCSSPMSELVFCVSDELHGRGEFTVARCLVCGLQYTKVRPRPEDLGDYYTSGFFSERIADPAGTDATISRTRSLYMHSVFGYPYAGLEVADESVLRRLRGSFAVVIARTAARLSGRDVSWAPHVPQGRLLEVGAGKGAVLAGYDALGWSVVGVEPDPAAAEEARRAGYDVRSGFLEESQFPDAAFDAVVLNHTIEHLDDLRGTINEVARVLKPGGWLLVRCPNAVSIDALMSGPDWDAWDVPRHLVHFSPATLRRFVEGAGFRDVHVRTEWRPGNAAFSLGQYLERRFGGALPRPILILLVALPSLLASFFGRSSDLCLRARRGL